MLISLLFKFVLRPKHILCYKDLRSISDTSPTLGGTPTSTIMFQRKWDQIWGWITDFQIRRKPSSFIWILQADVIVIDTLGVALDKNTQCTTIQADILQTRFYLEGKWSVVWCINCFCSRQDWNNETKSFQQILYYYFSQPLPGLNLICASCRWCVQSCETCSDQSLLWLWSSGTR